MKILKVKEERSYTDVAAFVEEHEISQKKVKEAIGCSLKEYEGDDYEAIEKLLPFVYSTEDSFAVLPYDRYISVIRIKTPKEVSGFTVVDVHMRVAEMNESDPEGNIDINDKEAEKVLDIMDESADSSLGVTWDDVDNAIVKYLKGRAYYQPVLTREEWETGKLASFQVYRNQENAKRDYPNHEIKQYNGDEIENYSFVD